MSVYYTQVETVLDEVSEILISAHSDLACELIKADTVEEVFNILDARDFLYPAFDLITRISSKRSSTGEYVSVKSKTHQTDRKAKFEALQVGESFTADTDYYSTTAYYNNKYPDKQFTCKMKNKLFTVTRVK